MLDKNKYIIIQHISSGGQKIPSSFLIKRLADIKKVESERIIPTHRQKYITFPDFKEKSAWVKKHKQPSGFWIDSYRTNINNTRIPDAESQLNLAKIDQEIQEYESKIKELKSQRMLYVVEHFLEWDLATLEDFPDEMIKV